MYLFLVSVLGVVAIIPLHFLSVEHIKLQEKFGRTKGIKIGDVLGLVSGWGFFLSWIGIWVSPQPRFSIPILKNQTISIPAVNYPVPYFHIVTSILFLTPAIWLGVNGVKETTLKVAETHRTEKIVTTGVYSLVRHPQYLGGLLAHVGISLLLSALYSFLSTPLMVALIFIISWKEEEELVREFGEEYQDYCRKVPMLIPTRLKERTQPA